MTTPSYTLDPRDAANQRVRGGIVGPRYPIVAAPGYVTVGGSRVQPIHSPGVGNLPRMASFWVAIDANEGAPAANQSIADGSGEQSMKLTHCVNRNGMVAAQDAVPPLAYADCDFDVTSDIVRLRHPGVWQVRVHIVLDTLVPGNFVRASIWWTPNLTENPTWIRMASETLAMVADMEARTGFTFATMVGTAHEMLPAIPPVPAPGDDLPALGPGLRLIVEHYGPNAGNVTFACGALGVSATKVILGCRLDLVHESLWHGKDRLAPIGTPPIAPDP